MTELPVASPFTLRTLRVSAPASTTRTSSYAARHLGYARTGPVGTIRGTGMAVLLMVLTLGIYGFVWSYQVHTEMKRHTGQGLDGGVALVLAVFAGVAMPYLTASEVGYLYTRDGRKAPVTGATGLWYLPGILILVGPIVWFVKTNGALNSYWRSMDPAAS